jgi:hypothetical protein
VTFRVWIRNPSTLDMRKITFLVGTSEDEDNLMGLLRAHGVGIRPGPSGAYRLDTKNLGDDALTEHFILLEFRKIFHRVPTDEEFDRIMNRLPENPPRHEVRAVIRELF